MYTIPLKNLPNFSFSVLLDGLDYRIAIRTIQDLTYMSVWIDGELLFYNQLCTPNNWVNVYNYISVNGKFFFKCLDNKYPNYKSFGITQSLVFYNKDEVEGVNEGA